MRLRYIILCIVALMSQLTQSQDLSKEITIEKEIVPEKRSASRMMVSPAVTLPAVSQKQLRFSGMPSADILETEIRSAALGRLFICPLLFHRHRTRFRTESGSQPEKCGIM